MNEAYIIGYDMRKCVCCGGLKITFNGDSQPTATDFYLIQNSSYLQIPFNAVFPIKIKVNWVQEQSCGGRAITITKFKKL